MTLARNFIIGLAITTIGATMACSAGERRGDEFGEEKPGDGNGNGDGTPSTPFGSGVDPTGKNPDENCAATTHDAKAGAVDIIFVIDTSESMDAEITQVKNNINDFAASIGQSGLDYRVIMLARRGTGTYDICVPPPLGGANCGDNPPHFYHVNQLVYSNDSLTQILNKYPSYKTNLRKDAHKVFVEITDDNQGNMTETQFEDQLFVKAFPDNVFGNKVARRWTFHSIVGWKRGTAPLSTSKCPDAVNTGSTYQRLSQLTGGIIDSVCESNYKSVLDNVATGIVQKLSCELEIPTSTQGQPVDPNKVVVQFTPTGGAASALTQVTDESKCASTPNGWYYDDNSAPSKILICQNSCGSLGTTTGGGKLEILAGCLAPPPR